jgi:hypothetical protein
MSTKRYFKGVKEYQANLSDVATSIGGGVAGSVPFQSAPSTTSLAAPTGPNQVFLSASSTQVGWGSVPTFGLIPTHANFIVFDNSTPPKIGISTNGITWSINTSTAITTATSRYNNVVFARGLFVTLMGTTASTTASTSTDGITWVGRTLPTSATWSGLAYANGLFVAVSRNGNGAATSTDAITWTARTTFASTYYESVTFGNNRFVATPSVNTSNAAASSTDGITWTASTLPASIVWGGCAFGAGIFVILASDTGTSAATSTDGITWTTRTKPAIPAFSLVYGASGFVATGASSSQNLLSTDGITWSTNSMPAYSNEWGPLAYSGGIYVAYSAYTSTNHVAISTNGATWTGITVPGFPNGKWNSTTGAPPAVAPRRLAGEIVIVSSNAYTVSPNDKWITLNTTGIHTITLPSPGDSGRELVIKQTAAFAVNSASANVLPLTSNTPGTAILTGAGKFAKLISNGVHWVIMESN